MSIFDFLNVLFPRERMEILPLASTMATNPDAAVPLLAAAGVPPPSRTQEEIEAATAWSPLGTETRKSLGLPNDPASMYGPTFNEAFGSTPQYYGQAFSEAFGFPPQKMATASSSVERPPESSPSMAERAQRALAGVRPPQSPQVAPPRPLQPIPSKNIPQGNPIASLIETLFGKQRVPTPNLGRLLVKG